MYVFGKRQEPVLGEGKDQLIQSNNPQSHENTKTSHAYVLNLLPDGRPFINVTLFGETRQGLLDSGAALTVKKFCPLIASRTNAIRPTKVALKAANQDYLDIIGVMTIHYTYGNKIVTVDTIIVNRLSQDLLLGFDFWQAAGLKIMDTEEHEVMAVLPPSDLEVETEVELQERDLLSLRKAVNKFLVTTPTFLGRTNLIEHQIELIDGAQPFMQRTYFYAPALQEKINKELDEMLERGVVIPSKSPVALPCVPVKKTDGKIRLCLDSRKLNALTKKDKFPIPNIQNLFARIEGANYLTVIDLSKAFWQIPLSNEPLNGQFATAQELTAFIIPGRGLYQFQVTPFGLCNSPATQCRLMYRVLNYDLEPKVMHYIDDILICAQTIQEMIKLIEEVAKRLSKANLSINLEKSRFFAREVKYLGYVLSNKGLQADPERIKTMVEYPAPKNTKAIRRFLGLTGYYRRLIPDFSGITAPLSDLLKKNVTRFHWNLEAESSFEKLKNAMATAPIVANPDFSREFHLQCDASDVSAAAALGQHHDIGEVIIAYWSHKWTPQETNWGATEKEAACVVYGIRNFRNYLWGKHFVVVTDAKAVTHVRTIKTDGSSKLARFALELNEYDVTIKHRAGRLSVVPDALSRAIEAISVVESVEGDAWYTEMRQRVLEDPDNHPDFRIQGNQLLKYTMSDDDIGCYQYVWKKYVPFEHRTQAVMKFHEDLCHLGWKKCLAVIRRHYFWPRLVATVKAEIRKCDTCKAVKSANNLTRVPITSSRVANAPFQMICLDHFGPVPRSRRLNTHLLVVVDVFSKHVFLHPCRDTSSPHVVSFLEKEIFLKFGVPETIISDNHRPLIGNNMIELLQKYHVTHWTTAAYHAQANPAERYIKTVSAAIRATLFEQNADHRKWDERIDEIAWALNNTRNESTGNTPFFVNFGRHAIRHGAEYQTLSGNGNRLEMAENELQRQFEAMRTKIRDNLQRAQERFRAQYNKTAKITTFEMGENVWRKNHELSNASQNFAQKLAPKYVKAKVIERIGTDTYRVKDITTGRIHRIHANDLLRD